MANVELSFGPMLIGVFMNMILYGVLIVQTYDYYRTYRQDAPWIRYLVLYLFIVESLNTGLDIAMMYQPLILQYGLPEATLYFPTMFATEPAIIVAVSTPIQMFFAWRIKLLTKSNWVAIIVVLFSIVSLAGGIWTTVMIAIIRLFSRKPELHTPALIWFIASCVSDILITISLVINLSKRKTGFVATDDAISKIIRMTVQTGMLTAFFAVGDVVFFMTLPHTALNFLWDLALSKLYSNCLLSSLNARAGLKEQSTVHSMQHRNLISGVTRRLPGRSEAEESRVQSGLFELEEPKSFSASSSFPQRPDIEYGITVTKVVERMEDPIPQSHESIATQ